MNFITGGPLEAGGPGQLSPLPPLNPALIRSAWLSQQWTTKVAKGSRQQTFLKLSQIVFLWQAWIQEACVSKTFWTTLQQNIDFTAKRSCKFSIGFNNLLQKMYANLVAKCLKSTYHQKCLQFAFLTKNICKITILFNLVANIQTRFRPAVYRKTSDVLLKPRLV